MDTTTDALFFIDTGKNSAENDWDINTETDNEHQDALLDQSKSFGKQSKNEKLPVILGHDDEEAELERLVFGGRADSLFKEEDDNIEIQSENERSDDEHHIYELHIDKVLN